MDANTETHGYGSVHAYIHTHMSQQGIIVWFNYSILVMTTILLRNRLHCHYHIHADVVLSFQITVLVWIKQFFCLLNIIGEESRACTMAGPILAADRFCKMCHWFFFFFFIPVTNLLSFSLDLKKKEKEGAMWGGEEERKRGQMKKRMRGVIGPVMNKGER